MEELSNLIGRKRTLFADDIDRRSAQISDAVGGSRVLVYGGAGSIGREVVRLIFRHRPSALHVIDISENNLVELVRDLRSSLGYISGETRFLPIDMGSVEASVFLRSQPRYDYVLNLAAMKHVRSEKDEFSLMRMIKVNVLDVKSTLEAAVNSGTSKYFAVSTDKAKNPANLMGATKRIMEDVLFGTEGATAVSTARFANVAFSDGSLLHGFRQRMIRRQPISAPRDVRRYFVTGEESGLLCLASTVLGSAREILFPRLDATADLITFSEIARRYLLVNGYEPVELESEDEAREVSESLIESRKWPCYFFKSDTSGEKPFEEFYSSDDMVDWSRFSDIGVIQVPPLAGLAKDRSAGFVEGVAALRAAGEWTKNELVSLISAGCPELGHIDTGRHLDNKM